MAAYPPSTSNPTSIPLHNGHLSPPPLDMMNGSHTQGENGLSDVREVRLTDTSPPKSTRDEMRHNMDDSDSAHDEEMDADADGDYDIETPPEAPSSPSASEHSSSEDSIRPPKRKALHDEDFIMNNPELYGLRRSVCLQTPCS